MLNSDTPFDWHFFRFRHKSFHLYPCPYIVRLFTPANWASFIHSYLVYDSLLYIPIRERVTASDPAVAACCLLLQSGKRNLERRKEGADEIKSAEIKRLRLNLLSSLMYVQLVLDGIQSYGVDANKKYNLHNKETKFARFFSRENPCFNLRGKEMLIPMTFFLSRLLSRS